MPIAHEELCNVIELTDEESRNAVMYRLKAMCRDGQLMSNRKNEFAIIKEMDLISARVIGHRDGFGFASPDSGSDIFLSARQMRQVFDGDKVVLQVTGKDHRGRKEGRIVEVTERQYTQAGGTLSRSERFRSLEIREPAYHSGNHGDRRP